MQDLRGLKVTVAGLGRFGGQIAAARWLIQQGATVLVTDRAKPEDLTKSVAQLNDLPITWVLGTQREEDFTSADLIVASPAIPPSNPLFEAARKSNVPVTTEIRLFIERCPAPIIGVTGTKGKSTTTAMLGRMLGKRFKTWVGGNIGKSLLPELGNIAATDRVVLELSSFMLEHLGAVKWSPQMALVTMVAADHLDWHGSVDAYVSAKANIVRFQNPDDIAVVNADDAGSASIAHAVRSRVVKFGGNDLKPFELQIPGKHNQANAQAAFAAAHELGVSWDEAQDAIRDFRGLPHRLELVHESNGVQYFNDSIATIPEAAVAALESFPPKRVLQIIGGSEKNLATEAMCDALMQRAKAVLCIGFTGPALFKAVSKLSSPTTAAVFDCRDLATAVRKAKSLAVAGDVILLSTGFASYDQFKNFEERGARFAELTKMP